MNDDRAVTCPRCGALPGKPCRTVSGGYLNMESHIARRNAQGIGIRGRYVCPCGRAYRIELGLRRHRARECRA